MGRQMKSIRGYDDGGSSEIAIAENDGDDEPVEIERVSKKCCHRIVGRHFPWGQSLVMMMVMASGGYETDGC